MASVSRISQVLWLQDRGRLQNAYDHDAHPRLRLPGLTVFGVSCAGERAAGRAKGSVAASDAFFPFADGLRVLIDAGIRAVVQPGGSVRDDEVFAAAREAGVTMYTTGTRHFFH